MAYDGETETDPEVTLAVAEGFEERGTPEQLAALYGALAEASGSFAPIVRDQHVTITLRSGEKYEYDYAPLKNLIDATRPSLAAAGVFIMQPISRIERATDRWRDKEGELKEEEVWLARGLTIVSHKGGGRLVFSLNFYAANDIKDFGGQVTYARRYQYQAVTGVDAGELDADNLARPDPARGEGSAKSTAKQRQIPTPPEPKREAKPQRPASGPELPPLPPPDARPASEPPPRREAPKSQEETLSTPVTTGGQMSPRVEPVAEEMQDFAKLDTGAVAAYCSVSCKALGWNRGKGEAELCRVTGISGRTEATREHMIQFATYLAGLRQELGA